MREKTQAIISEVTKAVTGKEEVIEKVLVAILAGGHILLEDIPGVGKTTLALAFSKAMGLDFQRMQFTPDVVPTDITGFTMYNKDTGAFEYKPGACSCNFFLADEINRTSSKTQSALLEVMQEGKVTVDGQSHPMPSPFIVIATQNPLGTAGTQPLPEAQLDRFAMQLSMGYPDFKAQVEILSNREKTDPLDTVGEAVSAAEIVAMKEEVKDLYTDSKIYEYVTALTEATRKSDYTKLGLSPRGALSLCTLARADAYVKGQDYVLPQNVKNVFFEAARHRIILSPQAHLAEKDATGVLESVLEETDEPKIS